MTIPKSITDILQKLQKSKHEAYAVGGCVRDVLRGVEPHDWDVATNAKPETIQKLFPKHFADNAFGTVTVITTAKNPQLKEVQITPYRVDEQYTDKRHPDKVTWVKTIEEDLARRDFTINALALNVKGDVIDPFDGQKDLKNKIIRAVGKPEDRFTEDALRMMRAVRFATTFGFTIEQKTAQAIKKNAGLLKHISQERIRDELIKIIQSERAADGIELLHDVGLLRHIMPELEENYGVAQNKHHIYTCYEHAVRSLAYAAKKDFTVHVRFAALLHDIAKPRVKRGAGDAATFYGHEVVGARMAKALLERLRFPKKDVEKITRLVRYHLFYYNVDEVTASSVRRLLQKVGTEYIDELLQLRMADRIGSGVPKAEPYKLRHLRYLIEKVSQDPISVGMLKISGNDVMKQLSLKPGPKVGQLLAILFEQVLDDPKKNTKAYLEKEVRKLGKLPDGELRKLAEKANKEKENIEIKRDEMTKKKYWVT